MNLVFSMHARVDDRVFPERLVEIEASVGNRVTRCRRRKSFTSPWHARCFRREWSLKMRLSEILRQCGEIERHVAGVYRRFAKLWPEGELGSFWCEMAAEEEKHADILDAASEYVTKDRSLSIDARVIARLRGYVKGLTSVRRPIDLDQALRTACEVERAELDRIYEVLVNLLGESFLRVSRTIAKSVVELGRHQERLFSIVERFAEDSGLRGEVSEWQAAAKNRSVSLEDLLRKPSVFPRHGRE